VFFVKYKVVVLDINLYRLALKADFVKLTD